jgi:hypothetical protein
MEWSVSSSSSSDSDEECRLRFRRCAAAIATAVAEAEASVAIDAPRRGGSLPGKAKNRDNGIAEGAERIDWDYFSRGGLDSAPLAESEFERRFRMPRCVYEMLREGILETDDYFLQKNDALGKSGASTDQKMVCALRLLAYSISADAVCEYARVSESTAAESLY